MNITQYNQNSYLVDNNDYIPNELLKKNHPVGETFFLKYPDGTMEVCEFASNGDMKYEKIDFIYD